MFLLLLSPFSLLPPNSLPDPNDSLQTTHFNKPQNLLYSSRRQHANMRPTTLLIGLVAAASAQSINISGLKASASKLLATGNPTSLLHSADVYASHQLQSLSHIAATATGAEASSLHALQSNAANAISNAESKASASLNTLDRPSASTTLQGAGQLASPSGSISVPASASSSGMAAITAAPAAMGAVGMAVLAML